jgi:hypothetical protein
MPIVQPMAAACTRKYQSMTSKLISSADVRMVSQFIGSDLLLSSSTNRVFGIVITYTSKNELIVFSVNESKDGKE